MDMINFNGNQVSGDIVWLIDGAVIGIVVLGGGLPTLLGSAGLLGRLP